MNQWRMTCMIFLMLALQAVAGISVDFDQERIESGKTFVMSLVVPIREVPPNHEGSPGLADPAPFVLLRTDSLDEVQRDFFMRGIKVRKYRLHLQAPKQSGRYTLKPVWTIDGAQRSLGSIPVEVERSYDAPAMVASLTPSKQTVYEGEQLSLTLSLLTYPGWQGKASPIATDLGSDFSVHRSDMKDFSFDRSSKPGAELEASARYAWLSPLRSGSLNIPAMKFSYSKVGAPKVVEKKTGNFSFRSVSQEPVEAVASTAPIRIEVKPLPLDGRPAQFNGLVGQYRFTGTWDKLQLQVGEAATLTLLIEGNGKPGIIPDPALPSLPDFRTVPPESRLEKKIVGGQVVTTKQLRLFLYPRKAGTFPVPAVSFAWFDPARKAYQTAQTPACTLKVEKGEYTEQAAAGGSDQMVANAKEIAALGEDIRHIALEAEWGSEESWHRSPLYWTLFLLPWLLLLGFAYYWRARLRMLGNAALMRKSMARQKLQSHFRAAQEANDPRTFYSALGKGLEDFLSDLYNKEFRGMTREDALKALQTLGLDKDQLETLKRVLEACDLARYAPVSPAPGEMENMLKDAKQLCARLEAKK